MNRNKKGSASQNSPLNQVLSQVSGLLKGASSGQSRQAPAKKKKNGSRGTMSSRQMSSNLGASGMSSTAYRAPINVSVNRRQAGLRVVGSAQQLTDIGGMHDNCRVIGSDLFTIFAAANGTTNAGLTGGVYETDLTPGVISPRLLNFQEMYQYYAIRELRVCYTNDVPSTTAGSIAVGIQQCSASSTASATWTQQQVLELTPSYKTAVWEPESCVYRHTGTKLWTGTTNASTPLEDSKQIQLVAALNAVLTAATFGSFWLEYIIDFYKPTPIQISPSLRIAELAERYGVKIAILATEPDASSSSSSLQPPPPPKSASTPGRWLSVG